MSDNSTLPVSVGTEVFANNDIGGVKFPRVKATWGAAGVANDTSAANPFPVSVQGSVTVSGVSTTAYDRGAGAATAQTTRVTIDTNQVAPLVAGGVPTVAGANIYQDVAASATNTILGTTGATGDYLEELLVIVATAATAQVSLKDGTLTAVVIFPANPGPGVGVYPVPCGWLSRGGAGGWQVSTQAGVTVRASGKFT